MTTQKRKEPRQRKSDRVRNARGAEADTLTRPRQQRSRQPLKPLTPKQGDYLNAIGAYDLVFCEGPAGTGKTFVAAAFAAEAFMNNDIEQIIITRPGVEAGESFGFLPGELDDKFAPFLAPVRSILEKRMGASAVEYALKAGRIQVAPLAFLRGHTFENAFVIFDEAQNADPDQMYLFLTRIGENSKIIIDGDLDQMDIGGKSGFQDAMEKMKGHPSVGFVKFDYDDIVRSGIVKDVVMRYGKHKAQEVGRENLERVIGFTHA